MLLWEKRRHHVFSNIFNQIHFILAGNNDIHKSLNEFEIREIRPWTTVLAALERLKKFPYTYNGENDVITFSPLFFIRSFSYLQAMRTCIKARMSSKFGQIRPLVSMATDSVIIWKMVLPLFLG